MRRWLPVLTDVALVLGLATICAGIALVSVPAALIVAGVLTVILVITGGRGATHGRARQ